MNNYWSSILIMFFCIQNVCAADRKYHQPHEYNPEATATLGQYAAATFFYSGLRGVPYTRNAMHGHLLQDNYRKDFFKAVQTLVDTENADPNILFMVQIRKNKIYKQSLLVRILGFDRDFPDKGGLAVARVLLQRGADPNHEENPLIFASSQGIRLLGEFGAVDKPFDQTQLNARSILAQYLLDANGEPFDVNLEKIKALCAIGSNVNCSYQRNGKTPLEMLLDNKGYREREKCEIICVLIDHGLNLYEQKWKSFFLMKKQFAPENVQELSRHFQERREKAVRLARSIKAKKIELDCQKLEDDAKKEQVQKAWNPDWIPIGVHEVVQHKKWWWQCKEKPELLRA